MLPEDSLPSDPKMDMPATVKLVTVEGFMFLGIVAFMLFALGVLSC